MLFFLYLLIFSTFIYNNTKQQLIESLYIQAKSINKLIPSINDNSLENFNVIANNLGVEGYNKDKLRVTIINDNWTVIGDSFISNEALNNIEKHSPETRIEIKNALLGEYGTDTRISKLQAMN